MRGLNDILSLMGKIDKNMLTEAILMEATRDEIYAEYYDEQKGKTKRIPREKFDYFCELGDVDNNPNKMSEFAKWLCDLYGTPKYDSYYIYTYKGLKQDFITFRKLQKIKPKDVNLNLRSYSLHLFVEAMEQAREKKLDMSQKDIKNLGCDSLYKDDTWSVVLVKTYEASKFYGSGTKWCTASNKTIREFAYYNNRGFLVIFINLQTGEKYQSHYNLEGERGETRNAADIMVNLEKYVPTEIIEKVSNRIQPMVKDKVDALWNANARETQKINDVYSVYYNAITETKRIKNTKTGEFFMIDNEEFTEIHIYPKYKVIGCEINYGRKNVILFYDENSITVGEKDLSLYYFGNEGYGNKNNNDELMVIAPNEMKRMILNVKTRQYLEIGGTIYFKWVGFQGNNIIVRNLFGKFFLYLFDKNEMVVIDGIREFDNVCFVGGNHMMLEKDATKYFYSAGNGLIYSGNDLEEIQQISNVAYVVTLGGEDPKSNPECKKYKLYSSEKGKFLSSRGKDIFEGAEFIVNKLLVLFTYDEEHIGHLFSTTTNEFSESTLIPMDDRDVEAYYDDIILFWGDDEILYYYRYSTNKTYSLPITITFDSFGESRTSERIYDKHIGCVETQINDIKVIIVIVTVDGTKEMVILSKNDQFLKQYFLP